MAGRRATPDKRSTLGGRGMKKGLVKTMFSVEPRQLEALREEATLRMQERKVGRIDASEVLREALDAWMKRRRG